MQMLVPKWFPELRELLTVTFITVLTLAAIGLLQLFEVILVTVIVELPALVNPVAVNEPVPAVVTVIEADPEPAGELLV